MRLIHYDGLSMPISMSRGAGPLPSRNLPRLLILLLCLTIWSTILANMDISPYTRIAEDHFWFFISWGIAPIVCLTARSILSANRFHQTYPQWRLISQSIFNFASLASASYHLDYMSTLPQDGVFGTLEDFVIALGLYERPEVQDIIITTGEYDDIEQVVSDTPMSQVRSAIKWFRSLAHEANPNPLDPRKLWIDLHLKVWEMRQSSEIDEPTADKLLFLLYDIKANLAPVAHFSIDPCNLNLALPLRILTIMFCFTLPFHEKSSNFMRVAYTIFVSLGYLGYLTVTDDFEDCIRSCIEPCALVVDADNPRFSLV